MRGASLRYLVLMTFGVNPSLVFEVLSMEFDSLEAWSLLIESHPL